MALPKPTGLTTTTIRSISQRGDGNPSGICGVENLLRLFDRFVVSPTDAEMSAAVGPGWREALAEMLAAGYLRERPGGGWQLSSAGREAARLVFQSFRTGRGPQQPLVIERNQGVLNVKA